MKLTVDSDKVSLLTEILESHGLSFSNISFVNVLLSDMAFFPRLNAVYGKYYGVSPPARACIAAYLPEKVNIRLDCLAYREESPFDRRAIHVQGLSYWAPANIGPYSQAITVRFVIRLCSAYIYDFNRLTKGYLYLVRSA